MLPSSSPTRVANDQSIHRLQEPAKANVRVHIHTPVKHFVRACSEWASGLSFAAEQSIGRSQEAWIGRLYKVDFVKEGHVQSGQVGFPLLANKALSWVKKHGYGPSTSCTLLKKGCSECASELSLAAEQSIEVGSRNMDIGFLQVALFSRRDVQSGQVSFPSLLNKKLAGVKNHGLGVCTRWTLLGHVESGQVGFPLLLNKALKWCQEHEYGRFTSATVLKKGCSKWASGLSLAAEQSIEVGSRNMNMGFLQVALF